MEDSQLYAAEREYGQMYDDADFISEIQGTICREIEPCLWTNSESAHDLKAAESIIEHHTGTAFDISEILFDLAESDGMSSGVECNPKQIYGFIADLMYSKMNNDSALELASILTDYVTQEVGEIIEHHKQRANDYDGPDSDEDF